MNIMLNYLVLNDFKRVINIGCKRLELKYKKGETICLKATSEFVRNAEKLNYIKLY